MNLLPLPALDGGRLLFLIIEAIRRKRIDPEQRRHGKSDWYCIVVWTDVFVMFNDIRKLFI